MNPRASGGLGDVNSRDAGGRNFGAAKGRVQLAGHGAVARIVSLPGDESEILAPPGECARVYGLHTMTLIGVGL